MVSNNIASAILFVLFIITNMTTLFFMNLYLEEFSDIKNTGDTRSMFLVIFNLGVILSIILGKLIESTFGIHSLFLFSAIINIPIFGLLRKYYESVREPIFKSASLINTINRLFRNRDISIIILSSLALESFYVIMNIYFPLYILNTVGVSSWVYFGVLLPVAILPYLILPNRLGKLATNKYGEKEMLISSIVLLIILFSIIPLVNSNAI
ncbi:MAG: MFS transporter [Cyanobium sp. MAG06]|nr:MFS transporter [Cyanobium sp. MAG06]